MAPRKDNSTDLQLALVGRRRPDAGHPTVSIGDEAAFGLVEDDQYVPEGIADAGAAANRNLERGLDSLAAGVQEQLECVVDIFNQNIGFGTDVQVNYELGVGVRKGEADRFRASPQQTMPKPVAIEGDGCVEIGDAKQKVVELSEQWPVGFMNAL